MPSHFFGQISWSVGLSVLTFVLLVGAAVIVLLSRKREEVNATNTANVAALNGLLSTKKEEVATLEKKLKKTEDDLRAANEQAESLAAKVGKLEDELKVAGLEYNQLALLDTAEWLKADKLKRENEALRDEVKELNEEIRGLIRSQMKAD